jgi:hypothetical protein
MYINIFKITRKITVPVCCTHLLYGIVSTGTSAGRRYRYLLRAGMKRKRINLFVDAVPNQNNAVSPNTCSKIYRCK